MASSVRHYISLLPIINSFPNALQIFLTSIIKTAKTLYTFFCASSAPRSFVELVSPPLYLHTYRINQSPLSSAPFCFVLPFPGLLLPALPPSMLLAYVDHFLCSYAILCHIVARILAVDTIHMLLLFWNLVNDEHLHSVITSDLSNL